MNALVDAFQADAKRKLYKLLEVPEITETIGPKVSSRMSSML